MQLNPRLATLAVLASALMAAPALAADGHAAHTATKSVAKKAIQTKKPVAKKAVYVCPMDPDVTSDKPGDCPKCGMHLEKKTK